MTIDKKHSTVQEFLLDSLTIMRDNETNKVKVTAVTDEATFEFLLTLLDVVIPVEEEPEEDSGSAAVKAAAEQSLKEAEEKAAAAELAFRKEMQRVIETIFTIVRS